MAYQPIPTKSEDDASANGDAGIPVLGIRQDSDVSPVSADGDYHHLLFNNVGRLKVAAMPGDYVATTGNITANGQSVTCDVSKASNVMLYCTGTFSTINCSFEGSIDSGTSWFGVQGVRTNSNTVETATGNLSAAPTYAWEMSVNALTNVRVRATAFTSGTQTWRILPGAYATEPIPAIQSHAITIAANATTTPAKARDSVTGASDTGIPAFFVRRDTPTSLTPVAGDYEMAQIDQHGALWIRDKSSTTSVLSNVAASATSVTVLALNANRRGGSIYNDSTATLYLKLGATASTTSYTVKMYTDDYYEIPFWYTGVIDGIWSSATGSARVTEVTS
ncbi:MAG: hypothetical protein WAW80_02620 [Candidatus Saccharimonadales bacterium]